MRQYAKITFSNLILILTFFHCTAFSQEPPIKWGDIPRADLEMKSYPADTNASALILCDYGESSFGDDLEIIFKRHLRVKIFTTKGYEMGTIIVLVHTKRGLEDLSDIEGVTYSLNDGGEIVETELSKKDVFKEDYGEGSTRYRLTLPALKPGCVFELRYKITEASFNWFLMRDWIFQTTEPVRWSEYRVKNPKSIAYSFVTQGYEPFAIEEEQDAEQFFSGYAMSYFKGQNLVHCTQRIWAVKDVPAIREEPYITTSDDYVNKIDIQLSGYFSWEGIAQHPLTTWDKFVDDLRDDNTFSKTIDDTKKIRKQTESITAGMQTPEEKLIAIHNWLASSIVYSGYGIFAKKDIDDVLEDRKGNSADITFLLLSMLKCVGIEGAPVIVSTRDHGKLQEQYPIYTQFNYVLARVIIGNTSYFIDATDSYKSWDLLPTKVLGVRGLVIKDKQYEWVTVGSQKSFNYAALANVSVHDDGSVKGTFENFYKDYANLSKRRVLKDKKDIEMVKQSFETETNGFAVDSIRIDGKDSINQPIGLKAWVSSSTYAQANGDFIYINPNMINRFKDNPFKIKIRKFPVDFAYKTNELTVINIEIPDSFEVKEKPVDREFFINGDRANYSRRTQIDGRQIQIACKFNINEIVFKPGYYEQLQKFYGRVIDAESEQIVLSRIHPPAAPVQEVKAMEAVPDKIAVPEIKVQKKKGKK